MTAAANALAWRRRAHPSYAAFLVHRLSGAGLALFLPHEPNISWAGFAWNQLWVITGNIIGGGVFVGGLYWLASPIRAVATSPVLNARAVATPLGRELRP